MDALHEVKGIYYASIFLRPSGQESTWEGRAGDIIKVSFSPRILHEHVHMFPGWHADKAIFSKWF